MAESVCPPRQTLIELGLGRLRGGAAAEIRAHVETCPKCSIFLVGLGETAAESAAPDDISLGETAFGAAARDDIALSATATESGAIIDPDQVPQFVAEFRLVRTLGQGAMGQVFLAQDTFLDRLVAVKFLTTSEFAPAARERFFVEARAVARLQHPNVVTLYRAGEEQGRRYLVSEYVRGQSLERAQIPLPWQKVLEIGLGLSRGLAAAHQRGVLHRDIKPANAMLTEGGEVKILDFGLAKLVASLPDAEKPVADGPGAAAVAGQLEALHVSNVALTRTGTLLGTPLYMAPEIWRGEPATTQTDVYSLGAMFYELCAGRPPYDAETAAALSARIIGEDATPLAVAAPSVDVRLAAVIDRCLQRDPAKRFTSGEQVREALERIATKAPFISRRVVAVGLSFLIALFMTLTGVAVARDRQAKQQAELAQRLGQEISAMEWLLRSARQLSLHDLDREKGIVRRRMEQLQAELAGYGTASRGLAHYALGRGHLALHEYPQALSHLQQAIEFGVHSAEVYYALGLVLGKHFEQAMSEVRLSGGGDWAKQRLKEIEPKYLVPAIAALMRSRSMKLDAPQYLEALIAYYQRDYDTALHQADAALRAAPWLYEASKLSGDVHLERALQAEQSGRYEEAERDFTGAVRSYEAAAAQGRSDAEVYEGLAETWFREIAMASDRGQTAEPAYAAAVAVSDKIEAAEPNSIAGSLKKAFAALMTIGLDGTGLPSAERVQRCLTSAESVLKKDPKNPYASEAAADCLMFASEIATARGEDPEPLLRKALSTLDPVVRAHPTFLWGLNDLANISNALAIHLQLRGNPAAKGILQSVLQYADQASALDSTYVSPLGSSLISHLNLLSFARSDAEMQSLLTQADDVFARCKSKNDQYLPCHQCRFFIYTRAAWRTFLAGQDPLPRLQRGLESLAIIRRRGGSFLDVEQHAMLAALVEASASVRAGKDPGPALAEMDAAFKRCLAIAARDAQCLTLGAQAEWVQSQWLAQKNQPAFPALQRALLRATDATQSPEQTADAWQVLSESHLRLYLVEETPAEARNRHIAEGLAAVEKAFAINPNHASGLATQGALLLVRAQSEHDLVARQVAARDAVRALEKALKSDPFLDHQYAPTLASARALLQPVRQ